jgi:hypothetical protein
MIIDIYFLLKLIGLLLAYHLLFVGCRFAYGFGGKIDKLLR